MRSVKVALPAVVVLVASTGACPRPVNRSAGRVALLALTLIALATGCVSVAGTYPCQTSPECVQGGVPGTCEPVGFCSFPDPSCASGHRYALHAAPALAARCTGDELLPDAPPETTDGGVDAPAGPCNFDDAVDEGEQCDDADHDDEDGCVDCRWATCGDGHVRADVEECDPPGAACTTACVACPASGLMGPTGGTCWELVSVEGGDFYDAVRLCEAQPGGHLAAATTEEELDTALPRALALAGQPQLYFGLQDFLADGDWYYSTGETTSVFRWALGNPNGGVLAQCVATTSAGWDDLPCTTLAPGVCEREPTYVDPTTGHAYRRQFDGATQTAALAAGCAHGGTLAVFETLDEVAFVRGKTPPRTGTLWTAGTYADGVITWPTPGLASGPWATSEPSAATGCVGVKAGGLAVRPCNEARELLCELED